MPVHLDRVKPDLSVATEIAASGFSQPYSPELEVDVRNHLELGDLVFSIVLDGGDRGYRKSAQNTVGFAIFQVWDDILFIGGIIMNEEYQQREAVKLTIAKARSILWREGSRTMRYLAFRTQSLHMWVAGSRETEEVFPSQAKGDAPQALAQVGARVAQEVGSAFPVGIGTYGGPLYGQKPVYRHNRQLQSWWDGICDFDRGDAVICVGKLPELEFGNGG